jgi:hypothetical protein
LFCNPFMVSLLLWLASMATIVQAQNQGPMMIQATARGTSTQMGKLINVNIHINQFSTEDDRKTLIAAFSRSGQDGLIDALEHMKGKGRFSTPYGVGNEVKYIIELPPNNGRRHIRLITNRRISFGEAFASTRSEEYSVGALDLFLTPGGKDSEGTVLPACKLKVGKKTKQIEIETLQNPWKLTNLMINKK